jgi:transcriptional regulator with XRE-family HTH domain
MTDTQQQGVMAMVKIDGGKVKQLREQKGLTQLYVATVVQVTTDTISRWENKRYPTIKKENGIRLAEALEVEIDEILETTEEDEEIPESPSGPDPDAAIPQTLPRSPRLLLFFVVIACAAVVALATGWFYLRKTPPLEITARRILPDQCTEGQPFPVTIEVTGNTSTPLAVIVKEQIPEGMSIQATEPPLPASSTKNDTLKWLQKIEGKVLFTYIATLSRPLAQNQKIIGSVAAGNDTGAPVDVTGNNSIQVGTHHWADSDGDNVISDKEILTVYDQYGDLEKLGMDIDLIEEIWLGSGYRWDVKKQKYEILP